MLKDKRNEAGLSQSELAARSGVPMRTIQHWERHGALNAKAGNLKQVADALGCTVSNSLDYRIIGGPM